MRASPLAGSVSVDQVTTTDQYAAFLERKAQLDGDTGFDPDDLPDYLFPFQADLVTWALRKGRAAIFADCGMGKTIMELVWAQQVAARTGKPVLVLTPLAVAGQFVTEAERFGIEASRSIGDTKAAPILVANYERLHHFDPSDFGGLVCDESSILKSFEGVTKAAVTEFMRRLPYRLLGTATAAPNDYIELGTSSEALGYLGYMDMLGRFFTNRRNTSAAYHGKWRMRDDEWRFKGHAETAFWQWVSSWARALRRPSDLGYSDAGYDLDPYLIREHTVEARTVRQGTLFDMPAVTFQEEREERRRTVPERCERVAELVTGTGQPAVVWCGLNDEGDLLERLIPDGVQVSGKDDDDSKEAKFEAFRTGDVRVLITKPTIGAWGLNWQHCSHVTYFPTHSYEQFYQAVRRCWRFGQTQQVVVDIVATPAEVEIQRNVDRKAEQAARMFSELVAHMRQAQAIDRSIGFGKGIEVPAWLS